MNSYTISQAEFDLLRKTKAALANANEQTPLLAKPALRKTKRREKWKDLVVALAADSDEDVEASAGAAGGVAAAGVGFSPVQSSQTTREAEEISSQRMIAQGVEKFLEEGAGLVLLRTFQWALILGSVPTAATGLWIVSSKPYALCLGAAALVWLGLPMTMLGMM